MKDWPVLEKIFPCECQNPDCNQGNGAYTLSEHLPITDSFVLLTNEKFFFFGFTCPSCFKTTMNKYSMDLYEFLISKNKSFKHFVPFHSKEFQNIEPDSSKELYHVPGDIPEWELIIQNTTPPESINYPKWFKDLCIYNIDENDILKMVEYENANNKKLFPRVIGRNSVYYTTDDFLGYLQKADVVQDNFKDVGAIMLNDALMNIAKSHYLYGYSKTSITKEEYQDLDIFFTMAIDFSSDFLEKAPDMLKEYVRIRSNLDFEKCYKPDFLDKYILEFYYSKGYYKSLQRIKDKMIYEEMFGKQFTSRFQNIENVPDFSDSSEMMTHTEILKRWDKDISILKIFITKCELPAFLSDYGIWLNPRDSNFDRNTMQPENYLFLKSDVEELEILKPWLNKNKSDDEIQDSITGKESRELGQLRTEKKKWEASIEAAVQIGIWVEKQKGQVKRKEVQDKLFEIDDNIPNTTFEMIWKAIPDKKRHSGGRPKKTEEQKLKDQEIE